MGPGFLNQATTLPCPREAVNSHHARDPVTNRGGPPLAGKTGGIQV